MAEMCEVCNKTVNRENCIEKDGVLYCCEDCEGHKKDPEKSDTKDAVCEFC